MSHDSKIAGSSRQPPSEAKAQSIIVRSDPNRSATRPSNICSTALPAMKQVMSEAMRPSVLPSAAP